MKKILLVILIIAMVTVLSACNMAMGMGNFEFNKIHIDTYHYSGCFTIQKWYNNESGIEVKTKEAGSMFLSEGTYILIEDKCPFCGNGN